MPVNEGESPSTIRQCPRCKELTPTDRSGCVHCDKAEGILTPKAPTSNGGWFEGSPSAKLGCLGLAFAVIAAPIILLSQCGGRTKSDAASKGSATPVNGAGEIEIVSICDLTVKGALVSESSYDPAFGWDYAVNGNVAEVLRKYEARNAFGAALSSAYDCKYDIRSRRIVFLQTIDSMGARTLIK